MQLVAMHTQQNGKIQEALIFTSTCILTFLIFTLFFNGPDAEYNNYKPARHLKQILFWSNITRRYIKIGFEEQAFHDLGCLVTTCEDVNDKKAYLTSDAIIVHLHE